MSMGIRYLILGLISATFVACASKQERAGCDQRDWFEIGRHDGAQGSTGDQLQNHTRECGRQVRSDWETMYANGRNAGLAEYCTSDNAFELGKMGVAYMYVCPSTMESKFLSGYREGQRARELEQENKNLEGKIETISEKISSAQNEFDRARFVSELNQLQDLKAENERQLDRNLSKHQ